MNSNLKVLKIVETEAPAIVAEALSDKFFEQIKMQKIPVLIQKNIGTEFSAFCQETNFTSHGEVVFDERFFLACAVWPSERQIKMIRALYLHECAHRITNQAHWGGFLCFNILLHIRAGLINSIRVYDFQQEKHFEDVFKWAFKLAKEMAETELMAEECSAIIMQKYKDWSDYMDHAPTIEAERLEQTELLKQSAINKQKKEAHHINNRIKILQQDRWYFAIASIVITTLLLTFFK